MDLFAGLSDDQLALLGCLGAILISMTIMSLSFYLGAASRASQPAARRLPHVERHEQAAPNDGRKAA